MCETLFCTYFWHSLCKLLVTTRQFYMLRYHARQYIVILVFDSRDIYITLRLQVLPKLVKCIPYIIYHYFYPSAITTWRKRNSMPSALVVNLPSSCALYNAAFILPSKGLGSIPVASIISSPLSK